MGDQATPKKFEGERDMAILVYYSNEDYFSDAEKRWALLDMAAAIRRAEKARQDAGDALPERPTTLPNP